MWTAQCPEKYKNKRTRNSQIGLISKDSPFPSFLTNIHNSFDHRSDLYPELTSTLTTNNCMLTYPMMCFSKNFRGIFTTLQGRHNYLFHNGEKIKAQRWGNLPRIPQLVSGKAKIQTQKVWLQSPALTMTYTASTIKNHPYWFLQSCISLSNISIYLF